MANPITFFEITARGAGALQEFYSSLFDWTFTASGEEGYSNVSTGDDSLGGALADMPDDMPATLTMFVEVEDLTATADRAKSLGGRLLFGPTELPNGKTIAMITDPAGINVGLVQG